MAEAAATTIERPEFVRPVETKAYGVVQKPLTAWEKIYDSGTARKTFLLVVMAVAWELYAIP